MVRIGRFIQDITAKLWLETIELSEWHLQRARYIRPGEYELDRQSAGVQSVNPLDSRHGTTYFLCKTIEIPLAWHSDQVGLVFEAGGEALLRVNGAPYHGLDRNHHFVPLPPERIGSTPLLEIELYDPIPEPEDPLNRQAVIQPPISGIRSALVRVNKPLQSLLYSVRSASEAIRLLAEHDLRRLRITETLHNIMDAMMAQSESSWTDAEWVGSQEQELISKVREQSPEGKRSGFMHMVGQSHIDVAWLWPVRETVRKSSRTFSTVCTLMEEYPDFIYSQSQPQLYAFVKDHYPELFGKIKERVAEGRWELVGGMWVEPDLNIPSGESLVRQILYGQGFYKQEFGKMSEIEWLPDTFGYCASLPQILRKAGIDYFMTTKLNWNDTNKFPYDLFDWVGIDGTAVTAYLNHGLNEHTHPKDIHEHWQSYRQKDVHGELMLLYGHGDGGGGVTREMIEYINRSELMPELPEIRFGTAAGFFDNIGKLQPSLPKWHGDLYLELHRGTYTTHARNKRNNRKAEVLYREAEIWERFAVTGAGAEAVSESGTTAGLAADVPSASGLNEGWKLILLNQFHDIIPGTSIPEVYETSAKEYDRVFKIGEASLTDSLRMLTENITTTGEGKPYIVFNSLGWERDDVISIEGGTELVGLVPFDSGGVRLDADILREGDPDRWIMSVYVARIPAFGYKTIWLRQVADVSTDASVQLADDAFPLVWDTDNYSLEFNDSGEIVRWYDKAAGRDWLRPGGKANEFQFFHDRPTYWDAWDIDPRFEEQPAGPAKLISKEVVQRGRTRVVLRFRWVFNNSEISQDVILYRHLRRVDFKTKVRWAESHILLKVAFPVDIVSDKATYEIPFGALERSNHLNTSWEQAQFEVCGHRWADLSEGNGGVSLLNDCKYGYDIKGSTIRLSLLRAPTWPDHSADQGEHEFTYSLYPHTQDWRRAQVVRRAMELNHQAEVAAAEPHDGTLPEEHSWIGLCSQHVVLDTIKRAEDGSGTILRFYESSGGRENITVRWPETSVQAVETNLLEETAMQLGIENGSFELSFRPFEIKTIKLLPVDTRRRT